MERVFESKSFFFFDFIWLAKSFGKNGFEPSIHEFAKLGVLPFYLLYILVLVPQGQN